MKLFKVVGSQVSKAFNFVAEKNHKAAMINRIRIVIKNERENTARAYVALGKYYYEHLRDAQNTETEALCRSVDESTQRINKAFDKLDAITAPADIEEDYCSDCNEDCDACPYYEALDEEGQENFAHDDGVEDAPVEHIVDHAPIVSAAPEDAEAADDEV